MNPLPYLAEPSRADQTLGALSIHNLVLLYVVDHNSANYDLLPILPRLNFRESFTTAL